MRRDRLLAGLLLACVLGGGAAAVAQSLPSLPESLRETAASLPAAQRSRLYRRAEAFAAMDAASREQLRRRLAEWQALPEAQRRERRERWQAWQALPAAERARLQAAASAFAALPVQEQLDLRARFAQLDESHRRGWLLGPALGADWERLQPLLMHVPADQRAPLLAALRGMTAQQRADLGVLAQRTPPQQRERLRRELLAQPPAARGRWLVDRLDR